jgi:HEAT repeat protein
MPMTAVLLLFLAGSQEDPRGLVEKLRSENVAEREAAARALQGLGAAAVPELEKGAKDADPEVAAQARRLLRTIEALGLLSPELRDAYPGVERRLADSAREWGTLLADASRRDLPRAALKPLAARALREAGTPDELRAVLHAIGRRGLHAALPELLAAARENRHGLRDEIAALVVDLGRPEAVPQLLELFDASRRDTLVPLLEGLPHRKSIPFLLQLLRGEDRYLSELALPGLAAMDVPDVKPFVLDGLKRASDWPGLFRAGTMAVRFGFPEAAEILRQKLPALRPGDRLTAASFLLELGGSEGLAVMRGFLDDEDQRFREGAASTLGAHGGRAVAGDIARLLRHPDPGTRTRAVIILSEMGAADFADAVARLARDGLEAGGDPRATNEVRCFAIQALGRLCGRGRLAEIRKGLEDPDLLVRAYAAATLARLGSKDDVPAIAELLAAPHWAAQSHAAEALAALGARDRAPAIEALLRDRDVEVRKAAVGALHRLDALPPAKEVARAVFAGIEPHQRIGAAEALCRAGIPEGVPTVLLLSSDVRVRLQEPPSGEMRWVYPRSCTVLNAVREPAAWKRLTETRIPGPLEGTRRELIDRLAKTAGLQAEWDPADGWEDDGWMTARDRVARTEGSVLDALTPLLAAHDRQPLPFRFDAVIEGGRLRILRYADALDAWEAWWRARPK